MFFRFALVLFAITALPHSSVLAQQKLPTARTKLGVNKAHAANGPLRHKFSSQKDMAARIGVHFKKLEAPVTLDAQHLFVERGPNALMLGVFGHVSPGRRSNYITFGLFTQRWAQQSFTVNFEGPVVRQRKAIECEVRVLRNAANLRLRTDGERGESNLSIPASTTRILSTVVPAGRRFWSVSFVRPPAHFRDETLAVRLKKCVVTPIRR